MSATITGLAGDMASFYNMDQDEAFIKLKSIFTGETETLKDIGVVMTQASLDQYAMANGYGKTTAAMTEQEKVALRYAFVQQQLSLASGDFIRTQNGWANQTRILKLQFDSFKASVGQGLINALTPVLKIINYLMQRLSQLANAFKTWTAKIFGDASATGSSSMSSMAKSADTASSAVNGVGTAAKKTASKVKKAARELMGFDKITKLSEKSSTSSGSGAGGISTGASSIADFSQPETQTKKRNALLDKIAKKYEKNIGRLKEAFGNLKKSAGKSFAGFYKAVLKPLGKWVMNKLAPIVIDMLAAAFQFLADVLDFIRPIALWLIKHVFKPMAQVLGAAIIKNIKDIAAAFKLMSKAIKWVIDKYKTLKKWFKEKIKMPKIKIPTIDSIKDALSNKWDEAKEWWDNEKEDLKEAAVTIVKTLKAVKDNAFDSLSKKWDAIKNSKAVKTISGSVSNTFSSIKSKWDGLRNKTAEVALKLKDGFTSLLRSIIRGIIDAINGIIKFWNKIPGHKDAGYIQYPKLAQGGYVKRNTPQLAMIGDNRRYGEVVAPENKLLEMAKQAAALAGNGNNQDAVRVLREILAAIKALDLDVYMSGRKVTDMVVREINARTKATGTCPINI